jgi:hypothetical protein
MWIGALLIGFMLGGFLFLLIDRLLMKRKN